MSYSTTVAVDLAKNVIQVSVISAHGKELLVANSISSGETENVVLLSASVIF